VAEIVELGKGWYLDREVKGKKKGNWVLRLNLPKGYPPSFEEIAQWLCVIGWLEDKKYPHGKGREYPREFISRAIKAGWPTAKLLKEYKLWKYD